MGTLPAYVVNADCVSKAGTLEPVVAPKGVDLLSVGITLSLYFVTSVILLFNLVIVLFEFSLQIVVITFS